MTDLSENAPFDEVTEVSNTDTLETLTDADIDAINEALAEAESDSTIAENATVEPEAEPFGNPEQLEPSEPVNFSDRLEEPSEPEPQPKPWDNAPSDCYFYDKTYEDGHLGSYTESAETAYKMGWDIEHNYIPIADTETSDVNGFTYPKELCPHKSERDKQIELWNREIFELKEELSQTDYKAIKYAEGVLTDEDYQPTGIQRQAWRKRINELERLIAG